MKYVSDHHRVGARSLPEKKLVDGVIASDKACMIIVGDKASIFNRSIPYERHYVKGVETVTAQFRRGDSFSGALCYLEGIESTYDMLLHCYGYFKKFGPSVKIVSKVPSCSNDGSSACAITSSHRVDVDNASGDISYHWEVTNASLVSGQGTDTVQVTTIGIHSIEVGIRCTVTDKYISGHTEVAVIHERISEGKRKLVPRTMLKPRRDLTPGDEN